MFCPFKHVIWFSDVPLIFHLFSCNAFIWWQFLIGSSKVYSRSCLELLFFSILFWSVWHATQFLPSMSGAGPVPTAVWVEDFSLQSIFSCFKFTLVSIKEKLLKANEKEKKAPLRCSILWAWIGDISHKKGILGYWKTVRKPVIPYSSSSFPVVGTIFMPSWCWAGVCVLEMGLLKCKCWAASVRKWAWFHVRTIFYGVRDKHGPVPVPLMTEWRFTSHKTRPSIFT